MEADALPRQAELRPDGRDHAGPMPDALAKRPPAAKSAAEWAYQRVIAYLKTFEENLDESQDVAMGFSGGPAGSLRIEGIGFSAPDLVTFSGHDDHGQQCQQVLHVSQLNVILRAVPRPANQPEPLRIGFRLARALQEAEDAQTAAPTPS